MHKKLWLALGIFALVGCITGIPALAAGIRERGLAGVNYGRVLFPCIISVCSFWLYRKRLD